MDSPPPRINSKPLVIIVCIVCHEWLLLSTFFSNFTKMGVNPALQFFLQNDYFERLLAKFSSRNALCTIIKHLIDESKWNNIIK